MSYQEYYTEIVNAIYEAESSMAEKDKLPQSLLKLWVDGIHTFCKNAYQDYITGHRESYYMSEEEYDKIFEEAGLEYTSELLNGLLDKDLVEVGVNENGEIVYRATDLARAGFQ